MTQILVLRDPRESVKKCSLTPLRAHPSVAFRTYHPERRLDAAGHVLLHVDGEPLSEADAGRPLLLVDCSWRRVAQLLATVDGEPVRRALPPLRTAYPRKSTTFEDPGSGLASVEALFAATALLGEPDPTLLEAYRWREEFLAANPELGRLA